MRTKSYPYSKSVMLNAVYDALDNLENGIERANSGQGTIMESFGGYQCRIMIETMYPAKTAKLTLQRSYITQVR